MLDFGCSVPNNGCFPKLAYAFRVSGKKLTTSAVRRRRKPLLKTSTW